MNVVEPFLRMARQQPGRPAMIAGGQVTTYGDLLANVGGLAAAFAADGVRAGDRVLVLGGPALRVMSTLALAWIGAASSESGGMPDDQLGSLADSLGLDAVYAPREIELPGSKARAGRIEPVVVSARTAVAPPLWRGEPGDLWRIVVSSGTTGRPKGIASPLSTITNAHLLRTIYPCGPGDVVVITMNAAMGFSVHNWLRCLYAGACVVLAENIKAPELLKLLQSDQPTHCIATVGIANLLAAQCTKPDAPKPAPGKRLHTFTVGGDRASAGVREIIRKHLCDNVMAHYGGAEMQIVAVLDPQLAEARPACSGRLLPWIEVEAIGEQGEVLPAGKVGRLRFRTPALASGYIGQAPDRDAFKDGWFLSQDRGVLGPDGLVFLHGRTNNVINLGGRKLDPEVLEDAIMADRNILECAIVDVDGRLGPELVAVIVDPSSSADLDALVERCRKAVPGVWPRRVMRAEKLPRNPNGKVMRGAVRKSLQEAEKEKGGGNAS